jgi:hypothetical protein
MTHGLKKLSPLVRHVAGGGKHPLFQQIVAMHKIDERSRDPSSKKLLPRERVAGSGAGSADASASIRNSTASSCALCGAQEAKTHCGSCKLVKYCGSTCQRNHWRVHKKKCQRKSRTATKTASLGNNEQSTPEKSDQRECAHCHSTTATLQCARCMAVSYCSTTCQKAHWKVVHKKQCRAQK